MDARIESANRASSLHKQRTGRALHITREIVQEESMYEEIDDTYRTKLQQYMRAQNMQLSRDFDNSLLAGFTPSGGMPTLQMPSTTSPGVPNQTTPSPSFSSSLNMPTLTQNLPSMHIRPRGSHSGPRGGHHGANHQRRASSVAPAGPIHAGRKMSLDFTQLRAGSIASSISAPSTDLSATSGSFSPSYPTPGPIQAQAPAQSQSQAQMPAYVASTPAYAVRPQQQQQQQQQQQHQQHQQQQHQQLLQPFDGLFQGHAMSPSSSFGGIPMHTPQFRNRIGSAPTIPVRAQAQALSLAQSQSRAGGQHSRNRSEPTPSNAEAPTPSSSSSSFSLGFFPHSSSNSDGTSTELMTTLRQNLSSLDLTDAANDAAKFDADQQMQSFDLHLGLGAFPHQSADQDFVDFSDFAATLDQSHTMFPFNFPVPVDSGSLTADVTFGDGPDMKEFITL